MTNWLLTAVSRSYGNFPAAVANVNILALFFLNAVTLCLRLVHTIFCDLREIKSCKDEPNRRNEVER